jgi:hypothetical protein
MTESLIATCPCLFHELACYVEQATKTAGASSSTTTTTSLTLHVELECHLSGLSNSILLRSLRVLHMISGQFLVKRSDTYSLALRLLLVK